MAFHADDPLELADELVDALDQGRLDDPDETGYAFLIAAEIRDRGGDAQGAAELARRAVEAYRARGELENYYPLTFYAEMLLRAGREEEAMAELAPLRPLMYENADAVSYICEALDSGGRPNIAEQWVTEALNAVLQRQEELESEPRNPEYRRVSSMVITLLRRRRWLRRDLNLPHDEHDELADHYLGPLSYD